MPTLEFKGKQFVYSHHLGVPFRELQVVPGKSLPAEGQKPSLDDNLIIHGDNLEALKALLPTHAGKVDCIFIDPPYNTGNEGWCYNDNVRSPLMKEWLKKSANPVDKEDLERHDKWLCMIWPRLQLLKELLSQEGVIFVCIDENELQNLKCLMDEVFGYDNHVADFIWHTHGHSDNQFDVKINHETILCYSKNIDEASLGCVVDHNTRKQSNLWRGFAENSITKNGPKNPPSEIELPVAFPFDSQDLIDNPADDVDDDFFVEVNKKGYITREITKNFGVTYPVHLSAMKARDGELSAPLRVYSGWANSRKLKAFIDSGCREIEEENGDKVSFYLSKKGVIYYRKERAAARNIFSVLQNFTTTERMSYQLEEMGLDFKYPKPVDLVRYMVDVSGVRSDGVILDSFAGSGTTAQAVLEANKKDNGNRRFILVECEDYADTLTAERVRRVIKGYPYTGTQREELHRESITWSTFEKKQAKVLEHIASIENLHGHEHDKIKKQIKDGVLTVTGERKVKETALGLGGSFTYCTLGAPIDIESLLTGKGLPSFEALARYVFYTATGQSLEKVGNPAPDGFIGETDLFRVHLFYQPEREWLRSNDAALNAERMALVQEGNTSGKRAIVFAVAKFMSQKELTARRIEFCQLPYAVHRILGD
ncbi:MAG: site-specific DNA-methyltransferase [Marinobacter sp.]